MFKFIDIQSKHEKAKRSVSESPNIQQRRGSIQMFQDTGNPVILGRHIGSHHQEQSRILQTITIEDVDRYNTQQF